MKKITISDSSFLQYEKSLSIGGTATGVAPTFFEWEQADPETARFVTDANLKHAKGEGQIALLLEAFFLHPEDYITAMQKPFDYVLTSNAYMARNMGWLYYPKGGSWINEKDWGVHEKTKDISILLSPKDKLPGHRLAHAIAEKFKDQVDVFGLDGWVSKEIALRHYRYSIVIEAERTPGFFSEKLIDCLSMGTVPIYWGDPEISCPFGEGFFTQGMLHIDELETLERLLSQRNIGSMGYPSTEIIMKNLETSKNYRIAEDNIWKKYPFLFEEK